MYTCQTEKPSFSYFTTNVQSSFVHLKIALNCVLKTRQTVQGDTEETLNNKNGYN